MLFVLILALVGGVGFAVLHSAKARQTGAVNIAQLPRNGTFTDVKTGMQIVINKVVTDTHGDRFEQPQAGRQFLMLYIRFINHGSGPRDINPLDVQVLGPNGQMYEDTPLLPSAYTQISATGVPAAQQRAGWVGYEVPSSLRSVRVTWDDASSLDPPADIGHYNLTAAPAAPTVAPPSPEAAAIIATIYGYQHTLDDVYGPSYSYSMVGEVATGNAAAAIQCVVQAGPNSLLATKTYLTYSNTVDQLRSVAVHGSTATAVVRIRQQIQTHQSDGAVSGALDADFTITFALVWENGTWKVSDYSWVGSDGSTGGAAKDAQPCPGLVAPSQAAPSPTSSSPAPVIEHYDVADYTEQGIKLDVVFMGQQYGQATLKDQRRIWLLIQICASSAGLKGVVVPVWDASAGEFGYLAPVKWQPYFNSVPLSDLEAKVDQKLTCHF